MFAAICLLLLAPSFSPPQSEQIIIERFPGKPPFTLTAIRQRSATEAIASWDDTGLPRKATARNAPLPPKVPGKKVREFLFESPLGDPLLAKAAPGTEIVQIVQDRKATLVAVAFPLDDKVASLHLALSRPASDVRTSLAFHPYDRFDPGQGSEAERFGDGLRWFALPCPPANVHVSVLGPSGEGIPLLGQVRRKDAKEIFVAVRAADAGRVAKIEVGPARPEWRPVENLLLDPAPPVLTRQDAPIASLPLEGGGKLLLLRFASRIPGRPYRTWTIDGGPPAPVVEKPYWAEMSPHHGLELFFQTETPAAAEAPYFQDLLLDGHWRTTSVAGGLDGMFRLYFDVPTELKRADLHVRYAVGPSQSVLEEPVRGERLRAVPSWGKDVFQPKIVALHYAIPAQYRDFHRTLEAYDADGRKLRRTFTSSESWPKTEGDGAGVCHFEATSPADVSRVRLLIRPLHRGIIKDLPLVPREIGR